MNAPISETFGLPKNLKNGGLFLYAGIKKIVGIS